MQSNKPVKETIQKIIFECQESGATKWQVLKILKELETISGTEPQLRKKAAETLDKLNPEASATFRSFERMKVFTSGEKREAFDRGNIIKSLIKETSISRAVAEKIGSEVEDEIKDLKIDYLNTPLIREMANVKLLGYGHEPIHSQYTRLGMPIFEVEKKLQKENFENPEILKEYNWLKVITGKPREMHFDSLIHIFNPEDFSTKIFYTTKFFEGKKEDILMKIIKNDKQTTIPTTLSAFNFSIATGISQKSKKKISEGIKSIEKLLSITKKRNVELALFNDFEWQALSAEKKKATSIANNLLDMETTSFDAYVSVDSRYKLKLLGKNHLAKELVFTNNSKERTSLFSFGVVPGNLGTILQLTGINLEKMLRVAAKNEQLFFEKLEETSNSIQGLGENKRQILEKRTSIDKNLLEESKPGVSLAGLHNASTVLKETNPGKIAEAIISLLQKKGFIVIGMPQETALEKFSVNEDIAKTQEILLQINSRQRKNYGFTYTAATIKELEELLNDSPCVKLKPGQ